MLVFENMIVSVPIISSYDRVLFIDTQGLRQWEQSSQLARLTSLAISLKNRR